MQDISFKKLQPSYFPELKAYWNFKNIELNQVLDKSGNDNCLFATGNPTYFNDSYIKGSVYLNGKTQWLSTKSPIIRTDQSFSIAAWVYLSADLMGGDICLNEGINALTVASQDSETHAGFYFGLRKYRVFKQINNPEAVYRWCFALAPITMDLPGIHVCSKDVLSKNDLNKWFFLVAVCDVENRLVQLHIPEIKQSQFTVMQNSWKLWNATKSFQVGRGKWEGKEVDKWPGSIGPIKVFQGVLSLEQSELLRYKSLCH
jgi:hypothetical protein